jgi:hypothetical protein
MRRNPDAQAQASQQSRDEAEDFRRAEAQDLRATVQELRTKPKATKPKGQDLTAKAQDRRAKEDTVQDPRAEAKTPELKPKS